MRHAPVPAPAPPLLYPCTFFARSCRMSLHKLRNFREHFLPPVKISLRVLQAVITFS